MQKKLIALAVAAAFSAPAFADTTVYGVLDAGYGDASKTTTSNLGVAAPKAGQTAIAFSTFSSSRFGVVNTEEMSNGMKTTLRVETGIGSNPMAGVSQTGTKAIAFNGTTLDATTLGGRELNLALALGEGTTIKAGFGSTPVRDFTLAYDATFGSNLVGGLLTNDATTDSNRATMIDVSHQFGPVKATLEVMANTDHTDNLTDAKKGNGYLGAVQYVQGPLSVGATYQEAETASNAVAYVAPTIGNGTTTASTLGSVAVAAADVKVKVGLIGASYDFGVAKAFAQYANIKTDDSVTPMAVGTGTRSYSEIGVDVPFGAVVGFAEYGVGTNNQVTTANAVSNSRNINGYIVGAKYSMSAATYGYVGVGETKLDQAAGAKDTGIKVDQYAIGLVHTF